MAKIILLLLIPVLCFSQRRMSDKDGWHLLYDNTGNYTPVLVLPDVNYPLTTYENGWMKLDGVSAFMKTANNYPTKFIYSVTDSFTIQFRCALTNLSKQMYLMGQWDGTATGWVIDYNINTSNKISLKVDSVVVEGVTVSDTLMHNYKFVFRKSTGTVAVYTDGVLTRTQSSVVWFSETFNNVFILGHGSAIGAMSDYTDGALDPLYFAAMNIDSLGIHKWRSGSDSSVCYAFNEGHGQYAYDINQFSIRDRTYPDSSYPGTHLILGIFPSPNDSMDGIWSPGYRKITSPLSTLGYGHSAWNTSTASYRASFDNGGPTFWQNGIVGTGAINRGNVPPDLYTNSTDTMSSIAYWDGSDWNKMGTNGSFFTGNITFALNDGDSVLYAGGAFVNAGGLANGDYIMRWRNNAWDTCGKGFKLDAYCGTMYNGKPIVGGSFDTSGTTAIISSVAQWNVTTNTWSAVGTNDIGAVWSLQYHNGVLYAGSDNGIWYLNGTTWTKIGLDGVTIYCLQGYRNELWYGGTGGNFGKATTSSVQQMGTFSGFVNHIVEMDTNSTDLYLIGSFLTVTYNGTTTVADKLARWNGRAFSPVLYNISLRPEGIGIRNDTLYCSGDQYGADGTECNNVFAVDLNWDYDDTSPAIITHTTIPGTPVAAYPPTVLCTLSKANGTEVSSAWVTWSINGVAQSNLTLVNTSYNFWSAAFPSSSRTVGDDIDYRIHCQDTYGTITDDTQESFEIISPQLPTTNLSKNWNYHLLSNALVSTWTNTIDTLALRGVTTSRPTKDTTGVVFDGGDVIYNVDAMDLGSTNFSTHIVMKFVDTSWTSPPLNIWPINVNNNGRVLSMQMLHSGYTVNQRLHAMIYNGSDWNSSRYYSLNNTIMLNKFALYSMTWDGTTVRLYVNGVLKTGTVTSSAAVTTAGTRVGEQFSRFLPAGTTIKHILYYAETNNQTTVTDIYNYFNSQGDITP